MEHADIVSITVPKIGIESKKEVDKKRFATD